MRALAKNLIAAGSGLFLLFVVEVILVLVGVTPLSSEDPFVGFRGSSPLFVPQHSGPHTVYSLDQSKERYFNLQQFRMPKDERTFRFVSFGGSTTYGRPYLNDTSFTSWTAQLLDFLDPAARHEGINAGGISYASYRVTRLMEEMAGYSPDLFIVYSGHNEFLEQRSFAGLIEESPTIRLLRSLLHRSRLYTSLYRSLRSVGLGGDRNPKTVLGEEVSAILEEIAGPELYHRDPAFRKGVIAQYRHNLEAMVRFCRDRDIPLVLCTLPSNLSGVSPFKSEHRDGLPAKQRQAWREAFESSEQAAGRGDLRAALKHLAEAEAIDDRYALLHFVKGNLLLGLGQQPEAYASFVRAKEEDIVPLRALEAFNEIVRDVARREGVPLADVNARFTELSPDRIPGRALFVDHVHPTIKGQQLIAWVITEALVRAGTIPVSRSRWDDRQPSIEEFLGTRHGKITPRYHAMGLWGVGRLFHWAGKYPEAYSALLQAWEEVKDVDEIPRLLGELELAQGRPQRALSFYREALALAPGSVPSRYGVVKAQIALGDGSGALATLAGIPPREETSVEHTLLLGEAQLLAGDIDSALANTGAAARMAPKAQRAQYSLAWTRAVAGDEGGAREAYRAFLQLADRPWSEPEFADLLTRAATAREQP